MSDSARVKAPRSGGLSLDYIALTRDACAEIEFAGCFFDCAHIMANSETAFHEALRAYTE